MFAEIARVVAGAVEEDGFAAAQEWHAHQVHAGRVDDAAVVTDLALAIEHRHIEPRIVGAEAGRPDDRPDVSAGEIHAQRRRGLDLDRGEAVRSFELAVAAIIFAIGLSLSVLLFGHSEKDDGGGAILSSAEN